MSTEFWEVQSSNYEHSEFLININQGIINNPSTGSVSGEVFTKKYGGLVSVKWRAALVNLKDWQEIDSSIWRHLGTWNVARVAGNLGSDVNSK
jgi:hypothetical protein